jgi:hypothetical protein
LDFPFTALLAQNHLTSVYIQILKNKKQHGSHRVALLIQYMTNLQQPDPDILPLPGILQKKNEHSLIFYRINFIMRCPANVKKNRNEMVPGNAGAKQEKNQVEINNLENSCAGQMNTTTNQGAKER